MHPTPGLHRALALVIVVLLIAAAAAPTTAAPNSPTGNAYYRGRQWDLSPTQVPDDPDRDHIAIANNYYANEYLAVWHTTYPPGSGSTYRSIVGQRIAANGQPIGMNFTIAGGPNDRVLPAVAYNGVSNEYLVVYMLDSLNDGKKYDLWGVILNGQGGPTGSPFLIMSYENRSFWAPEVISGGNSYYVIWGARAQDTQAFTDIAVKRLDDAGAETGFAILTTTGAPTNPDLAWDQIYQRYLAVWNFTNDGGKSDIGYDLRTVDNAQIRAGSIAIDPTKNARYPRVAHSSGSGYQVVFEQEVSPTNHDIWVTVFVDDASYNLPIGLAIGPSDDTSPDIAGSWFKTEYIVVYRHGSLFGDTVRFSTITEIFDEYQDDLCSAGDDIDCQDPVITSGRYSYLSAYILNIPISPTANRRHVFSRVLHTSLAYLPVVKK